MLKQSNWHDSQRGYFSGHLFNLMENNQDIIVLTGDLGWGQFDKIRDTYSSRFINCGASEQTMLDMAVGIAMSGKIPICYSITPFLIYRAYETIKLYIDEEKIPVILVGGGRGKDYQHDGPSHDATDIPNTLKLFKNIKQYWPSKKEEVPGMLNKIIKSKKPTFISLTR